MAKGKPQFEQQFKRDYERRREVLRVILRRARKESKLSQGEAAYMISSNQSFLSRVEKTGVIDFVVLERLAAVYGKPVGHFTTFNHKEVPRPRINEPEVSTYEGRSLYEWKYHFNWRSWPPLGEEAKPRAITGGRRVAKSIRPGESLLGRRN